MSLASNQETTGTERTDSKNDTKKTGRSDGQGGQKDLGFDTLNSPGDKGGDMGPDNRQTRESNFKANQGSLGNEKMDSHGSKQGNPSRVDKISEIGEGREVDS